MRLSAVLVAAASLSALAQTQRPGGQPSVRTGLIVGQVIEGGSNRPVPEAIVSLTSSGPSIDPRDRGRRVMADAEGRFFFADLSPGSYQVRAVKAGYPQNYYGPGLAPFSGAPPGSIQLSEGERRGGVTVVLWKYATLSGTVVDEAGEPVIGVDVRALRRSFAGGQLRFIPVNSAISSARTDDRGAFRIASLQPGYYIVAVASSQTTMPIAVFDRNLWQRNEEVMSAIPEFQILGYSQNQQIGDVVLMTRSGIAWPPAPSASGHLGVYPSTFYPSTASAADATGFSLEAGQERSGVTIQLKPVPAARVSGRLIGPNGPVALAALRLSPAGQIADVALDPVTGLSDQSGAFTLLGVPPGQYVLRVMTPRIIGAPIPPSTPEKPILWASEPVTVADSDVSGLTVQLRHTFRVAGRVEFLGSKPGPSGQALNESISLGFSPVAGSWGGARAAIDDKGAFEAGVAGGSYLFTAEDFPDWHLKAVMFEGRDISDVPVEIKGDVSGIVVQYSDDVSQIAGTVRTAQGAPDSSAVVIVFPADRQRWSGPLSPFPRRTRSTAVSTTGTFAFMALPPGGYLVAAIPYALLNTWQDPKVLETLSRSATRISLAENEKRSVDLKAAAWR